MCEDQSGKLWDVSLKQFLSASVLLMHKSEACWESQGQELNRNTPEGVSANEWRTAEKACWLGI